MLSMLKRSWIKNCDVGLSTTSSLEAENVKLTVVLVQNWVDWNLKLSTIICSSDDLVYDDRDFLQWKLVNVSYEFWLLRLRLHCVSKKKMTPRCIISPFPWVPFFSGRCRKRRIRIEFIAQGDWAEMLLIIIQITLL